MSDDEVDRKIDEAFPNLTVKRLEMEYPGAIELIRKEAWANGFCAAFFVILSFAALVSLTCMSVPFARQ